jgi:segregation and condensation protein B
MASLAEKRIADAEERSVDPEARPEELRLLEALLFASTEPLDQAALAKRMPEGVDIKVALAQLQADYALRGVNWFVSPTNGPSAPPAICLLMTRKAPDAAAVARGDRDAAIIAYASR